MDVATLRALNAARKARKPVVLVTEIETGASSVVPEGETAGPPGLEAALAEAFASGQAAHAEASDSNRYFLNPFLPPPRLVMIGAVHISQTLAPMAKMVGLDVRIIDPRTAFATPERFPGVSITADWPETVLGREPLDRFTAVAALTHDPKIDDFALADALAKGCFYVGALGSRKTHAKRLERLESAGTAADMLPRIHAPIGLPIGAKSPAEIAVSILAEVISALRKGATTSPKPGGTAA